MCPCENWMFVKFIKKKKQNWKRKNVAVAMGGEMPLTALNISRAMKHKFYSYYS